MGLFDKLFSNKDKQTDKKISESEIKKHFDSPYGKFWYSSTPACQEYGYECETDWNDGDDEKALVFVETDTPDTDGARLCYERFERIFQDKQRFDTEAKNIVADFIISHPQYFFDSTYEEVGKDILLENMKIIWLGVRRNEDTGTVDVNIGSLGLYLNTSAPHKQTLTVRCKNYSFLIP